MIARDRIAERVLMSLAGLSIVTSAGLVLMLFLKSVDFFAVVSPLRLFEDGFWRPFLDPPAFGALPLVTGTLLVTLVAMCSALPFGLLGAIYLGEFAPRTQRLVLKPLLEVLAAIPSIVFGYLALRYFTPALQMMLPSLPPFNALSAGLALGIMLLPTFLALCDDAIYTVPQGLREASYALGADRLSTLMKVVLPSARSGIGAAVLLAASRAVGETMIVAIACGLSPRTTFDPRQPVETVTAFMVQIAMGDVPSGSLPSHTLFALGLMLFVVTATLNLIAHRKKQP